MLICMNTMILLCSKFPLITYYYYYYGLHFAVVVLLIHQLVPCFVRAF
jgi:hypothetical protein